MNYATQVEIGDHEISITKPTFFIADIAANHDGDLERAKDLIWLAKEAGADVAKFQHFTAEKIVSNFGFETLKNIKTHQSSWKKPVFDIYDQYHTKRDWTNELIQTCRDAGIEFMTTPYDSEAVKTFSNLVNAFKIGSGDITFAPFLEEIANTNKPVILASGASSMDDTVRAVDTILSLNQKLILLQCNTNYTGDLENFSYVNLNVIRSFALKWPGLILGLSDHTPGHSAVLGAVTLGARVIEKHFTDDNTREGPDHKFALNPVTWRAMVTATRELEYSLGDGIKRVERNEKDTVIVQRRAMRAKCNLAAGTKIKLSDFEALRPCPSDAVSPVEFNDFIGKCLTVDISKGDFLAGYKCN